jgi:hypothetical protein
MRFNADSSTWHKRTAEPEPVPDKYGSLHVEWIRVAREVCDRELSQLSRYETYCIVYAAGCPVRLSKESTPDNLVWECAPFMLEKKDGLWVCHWREFTD